MNKKALPIVIAVAVVAIVILVITINRNLHTGTDLPMPAKPRLMDEARQHIMQRGNPSGMGMPAGQTSPAAGGP